MASTPVAETVFRTGVFHAEWRREYSAEEL